MIEHFVKAGRRGDLASCAVVFPSFSLLAILAPLLIYPMWRSALPADSSGWLQGAPFWLWMAWVASEWLRLVRMVRAEPERTAATGVFHRIQAVCLLFFAAHMLVASGGVNAQFLSIWVICVEVAMVVFFVNYFLLALWTWTRISWHSAAGFAFVIASLAFEIASAVKGDRWWMR